VTCACHGEPAYWQKDARLPKGGWWECSVRRRQYQRDRYDNDPIHRIEKNLKGDARKRRQTIERRRAALASDHGGQ
jgi:hypothetical protein